LATANSGTTYGVFGESTSTIAPAAGVYGLASVPGTAYGVQGRSVGALGIGVRGDGGVRGGIFVADASMTGTAGVFAIAEAHTALLSYGGRFETNSSGGIGVLGFATQDSGTNYGVHGHSNSPEGQGVRGTCDDNIGVFGEAAGTSGTTYGGRFDNYSSSGRGVFGLAAATSGTNYGVRGTSNSAAGYGVFSVGELGASGAKSFVIDHPYESP
jgi:hypothetical protein